MNEQTFITSNSVDIIFTMYKKELILRCKQIEAKYNRRNEEWFTYKDLFSESYIKIKNSLRKNGKEFESLDHFYRFYYTLTKELCIDYITKIVRRRRRYDAIKPYMYDESLSDEYDTILGTFTFSDPEFDIMIYEEKLTSEIDKKILFGLKNSWSNEKLSKHLKVCRNTLRQNIFSFRKRMFKLLQNEGVINENLKYNQLHNKYSKPYDVDHRYQLLDKEKYLISEYPIEGSSYDKVKCIISNFNKLKFRDVFDIYNLNYVGLSPLRMKNTRPIVMHELHKLKKEGFVTFLDGVIFLN